MFIKLYNEIMDYGAAMRLWRLRPGLVSVSPAESENNE